VKAVSLDLLVADGIIDVVLGQLKTGKEAEVWLVQRAEEVLAAKIYKERHHRQFRNNAAYKEGRQVRNSRTQRAMAKGSRFGQQASEDAWKSAEADALYKLHALGVRVPKPELFYEGILLMEVVIDATGHPAPRLIDAAVTKENARTLYEDLRRQTIAMLHGDLIHGDLSPFNVLLAWNGPTVIDFPQSIAAAHNNSAEGFFKRDLDNLRKFFAAIDPSLEQNRGDADEIWRAYVRRDLSLDFVPSGKPPPVQAQRAPRERIFEPRAKQNAPKQRPSGPGNHRPSGVASHRAGSSPSPQVSYRGEVSPPPAAANPTVAGTPQEKSKRRRRHRRR
jgi:RIO kinase 1